MEELRSTEVLDREILDDARKKAHKILKTADETLAAQNRDWEKKTGDALDSIRKTYADRAKKTTEEILARFPLDKRRLRSETSEAFLTGAMEDFLRALPRETLLGILERELLERVESVSGDGAGNTGGGKSSESGEGANRVELRYSGMTLSEVKTLLLKVPSSKNWDVKEASSAASAPGVNGFPCVVIDARPFRVTASVENAAAALTRDRRAELARALLGEGVLND